MNSVRGNGTVAAIATGLRYDLGARFVDHDQRVDRTGEARFDQLFAGNVGFRTRERHDTLIVENEHGWREIDADLEGDAQRAIDADRDAADPAFLDV
jgi:hypothetical protein